MDKKFINIKQAAKILGVSSLTLRNWDNSGKFPAGRHPISNYRVYQVRDLENLLIEMEESKGKARTRTQAKKIIVKHLEAEEEIAE